MNNIAIGSDHAGFLLKEVIKQFLVEECEMKVFDAGADLEASVDYPDIGEVVATKVSRDEIAKGILVCGSGIGMSIVANKFKGVRAALCLDTESAELSRQHNDSNIIVLAGRKTPPAQALEIVRTWLKTDFAGGRHRQRVEKIDKIEQKNR